MVGLLNELESSGLVTRRRATEDRRRHIVELTNEGRETLAVRSSYSRPLRTRCCLHSPATSGSSWPRCSIGLRSVVSYVTRKRTIQSYLMDMDGVLIREEHAIPGADAFIAGLREREIPFLVLTNNSIYTPRDLSARLRANGIDIGEENIWTSALATARFLDDQRPGGTAFVVGEAGLITALHQAGYTMTDNDPEYVVLGEARTLQFRADHRGDPADQQRRPLHRDQPGCHRPVEQGPDPRHRLGGRPDHQRHRGRPLLRRQAQPVDDALGAERDRRALREHGDDR